LQNLLFFVRALRRCGLPVTSSQVAALVEGLAGSGIENRQDVRAVAACVLVHRREDLGLFERVFDAFWVSAHDEVQSSAGLDYLKDISRRLRPEPPRQGGVAVEAGGDGNESSGPRRADLSAAHNDDSESEGEAVLALYSAAERMRTKDFATLTPAELNDAKRFLAEMTWNMTRRVSRRTRAARRGRTVDWRRSLRSSLRHGGEMLELRKRSAKLKTRPLILLCDISGSMEPYTRLLLHFLHSIGAGGPRTEVFLFGTRLSRITFELRNRDPDVAIRAAARQVQDWSGGTRIGDSLRQFNRRWARRVLGHGAVVIVISDGWDRGDPQQLAAEMRRLQRASHRLIWLNPLLGSAEYRPLTQGILAALPYVDTFLPVHNLHSLEGLAVLLGEIGDERPVRAQGHGVSV
jgi:uncharacterized protein with von Willebrand factor type A (vWA) domain